VVARPFFELRSWRDASGRTLLQPTDPVFDCEDIQIRQNVRPGGGDVDKTTTADIVPTHSEHAAEDSAT
jgi:hypothetical protein